MNILALDIGGYKVGWALHEGPRHSIGTEDFKPRRGDSIGTVYMMFEAFLMNIAWNENYDVSLIIWETAFGRGPSVAIAHGMEAHIQKFCAENRIEHKTITPTEVKTFALGYAPKRKKGDPLFDRSKEAMTAAAIRKIDELKLFKGFPHPNDHEADALWILWWAEKNFGNTYREGTGGRAKEPKC